MTHWGGVRPVPLGVPAHEGALGGSVMPGEHELDNMHPGAAGCIDLRAVVQWYQNDFQLMIDAFPGPEDGIGRSGRKRTEVWNEEYGKRRVFKRGGQ